jgi:hypothetical protein
MLAAVMVAPSMLVENVAVGRTFFGTPVVWVGV